jgi:CheY-like chemotaxis protein
VTRTFDPIASDKGLSFEVDADPALPATIVTDEQRLEQVLRNLLSNAFKFTEAGGVTLSIRRAAGERISFAVSDTGVGIAPDKLQVIFEAFQQADGTTSRRYGGTGLGLSISRELARALGGEIQVASSIGEGTAFTLVLPMRYSPPLGLPVAEDGDGRGLALATPTRPAGQLAAPPSAAIAALAPAEDAAPQAEQAGRSAGATANGQPAVVGKRVLVVERGDTATRAMSGLAARESDLFITTVASVDEAAVALAGPAFDCVVLGTGLAKSATLGLLERLSRDPHVQGTEFILSPSRPLLARESSRLRRLAPALSVKLVERPEQLSGEIALALHRTSSRPLPDASAEPGPQLEPGAFSGRKVLLVDDDVRNLFALASLLEDRGIEVVFGETGREALAALDRHRDVDLVLMDIMMPEMDGNETIAAIRQSPRLRELPIIAVTAKAMEGDRNRSLSVGASDYLTKPVEPERLLSLIAKWLRR